MKNKIDYNTYKSLCLSMAQDISAWKPDELVVIIRGGMTAAHIISKKLNLICGSFFPAHHTLVIQQTSKKVVFIEDVIAKGRTVELIREYMKESCQDVEWKIAPVIIDHNINNVDIPEILTYGLKTPHWIVMPYEEEEKVIERDWGLSRNNTDLYGKGK